MDAAAVPAPVARVPLTKRVTSAATTDYGRNRGLSTRVQAACVERDLPNEHRQFEAILVKRAFHDTALAPTR